MLRLYDYSGLESIYVCTYVCIHVCMCNYLKQWILARAAFLQGLSVKHPGTTFKLNIKIREESVWGEKKGRKALVISYCLRTNHIKSNYIYNLPFHHENASAELSSSDEPLAIFAKNWRSLKIQDVKISPRNDSKKIDHRKFLSKMNLFFSLQFSLNIMS